MPQICWSALLNIDSTLPKLAMTEFCFAQDALRPAYGPIWEMGATCEFVKARRVARWSNKVTSPFYIIRKYSIVERESQANPLKCIVIEAQSYGNNWSRATNRHGEVLIDMFNKLAAPALPPKGN
jgi:hypothetical protein